MVLRQINGRRNFQMSKEKHKKLNESWIRKDSKFIEDNVRNSSIPSYFPINFKKQKWNIKND